MRQFNICPVCGTDLEKGESCRICGYSDSTNYEKHMSLGTIEDTKTVVLKNYLYRKQVDKAREKQYREKLILIKKHLEKLEEKHQKELQEKELAYQKELQEKELALQREIQVLRRAYQREMQELQEENQRLKNEKIEQTEVATETEELQPELESLEIADEAEDLDFEDLVSNIFEQLDHVQLQSEKVEEEATEEEPDGFEVKESEALEDDKDILNKLPSVQSKIQDKVKGAFGAFKDIQIGSKKEIRIGDTVSFGRYKAEGVLTNFGKIKWIVLDKQDDKLLLTTKYILDSQPYNEEFEETTWEACSLRKWLNKDFLDQTFSPKEQSWILETEVSAEENSDCELNDKSLVGDHVFILSADEVMHYFPEKKDRTCVATKLAKDLDTFVENNGNSWWWLRDMGTAKDKALVVDDEGCIFAEGNDVDFIDCGVRPTIWLDLGLKNKRV